MGGGRGWGWVEGNGERGSGVRGRGGRILTYTLLSTITQLHPIRTSTHFIRALRKAEMRAAGKGNVISTRVVINCRRMSQG